MITKTVFQTKCPERGFRSDPATSEIRKPAMELWDRRETLASGFFCNPSGLFITNAHVFIKDRLTKPDFAKRQLQRFIKSGTKFEVRNNGFSTNLKLLHADLDKDIAVLGPERSSQNYDHYLFSDVAAKVGDNVHLIAQPWIKDSGKGLYTSSGQVIDGEKAKLQCSSFQMPDVNLSPDEVTELNEGLDRNIAKLNAGGYMLSNYQGGPGTSGGAVLRDDTKVVALHQASMLHPLVYTPELIDFYEEYQVAAPSIAIKAEDVLNCMDQWGYKTNDLLDGNEIVTLGS